MPEAPKIDAISIPRPGPTERLVALEALRLVDARNGRAPGLSTSLRLAWRSGPTGARLLARFDCRHRGIVATMREDNADLWKEDVVEAFIGLADPPNRYLELEVNPLGTKFSAVVDSPNLGRDGMKVEKIRLPGFRAEVRVRERRWSVVLSTFMSEVRELLATPAALRDPEGKRTAAEGREGSAGGGSSCLEMFRANFFRIDRASGQFSALFPTLADPADFHLPERFGKFILQNEA